MEDDGRCDRIAGCDRASRGAAPEKPMARSSKTRFPGESPAYRRARTRLLGAERRLRRQVEAVAAQRRRLPRGGEVPEDYEFEELGARGAVRRVRLSRLFAPGRDSLAVYSFMYGPAMKRPCPMCTSIVDALDATAQHAGQRVNLVVVAASPIRRIAAFARERGWRHVRLLSCAPSAYGRDYFGEDPEGNQWPMLNVFRREGRKIRHFWGSELFFGPGERGQESRHVDMIWPLWNLFDFAPEGRGRDWHPRLDYRTG